MSSSSPKRSVPIFVSANPQTYLWMCTHNIQLSYALIIYYEFKIYCFFNQADENYISFQFSNHVFMCVSICLECIYMCVGGYACMEAWKGYGNPWSYSYASCEMPALLCRFWALNFSSHDCRSVVYYWAISPAPFPYFLKSQSEENLKEFPYFLFGMLACSFKLKFYLCTYYLYGGILNIFQLLTYLIFTLTIRLQMHYTHPHTEWELTKVTKLIQSIPG